MLRTTHHPHISLRCELCHYAFHILPQNIHTYLKHHNQFPSSIYAFNASTNAIILCLRCQRSKP